MQCSALGVAIILSASCGACTATNVTDIVGSHDTEQGAFLQTHIEQTDTDADVQVRTDSKSRARPKPRRRTRAPPSRSCGSPPHINNSRPYSTVSRVYMQEFTVECEDGFTTDDGGKTFDVKCDANGQYNGLKECVPVSCGLPQDKEREIFTLVEEKTDFVFGEVVVWTCKEGFSRDGRPRGSTTDQSSCQANGEFEDTIDCVDIDFCDNDPCGANGVCTDTGVGKLAPGYNCSCYDGYEVIQLPDGGETCSEDDCKGSPCGAGGTCTDLSKGGASNGEYKCECKPGYELSEPTPGKFTCKRSVCGKLPSKKHAEYEIHWSNDRDHSMDGTPILSSSDRAKWTCVEGYSTDGTTSPLKKSFSIECKGSGSFEISDECRPVRCDSYPLLPNTIVEGNDEYFFEYGDEVTFNCNPGYTIGGGLDDKNKFTLACRADGKFHGDYQRCIPIKCPVLRIKNAFSSASGRVNFDAIVPYSCREGYAVAATGSNKFEGVCTETGEIIYDENAECVPVSCGVAPPQPNAVMRMDYNNEPVTRDMVFDYENRIINVVCNAGYTVGGMAGGDTTYTLTCKADGAFAPVLAHCDAPKFAVSGRVTDAQAASRRLRGVVVNFKDANGSEVATAVSDFEGKYSVKLAIGTFTVEATKEGYITASQNVTVKRAISVGGAADLSLSRVLAPGEYRVVLNWGLLPTDLDSHTYFGPKFSKEVNYSSTSAEDSLSGIAVELDRDDVTSYGPETTTFRNIGKCTKGNCMIYFYVKNYGTHVPPLGSSEGKATLYGSDGIMAEWYNPHSVGANETWGVFTLNARKNAKKVVTAGILGPPLNV